MREEAFRYGEHQRGFGMLTLPEDESSAPIVVTLNAGLLCRSEPYRMNVQATRSFASLGYIALRIDLSGKGDTPIREGLTNRESVATDWRYIEEALQKRFGKRHIILMGLCSGADNAVKLAAQSKAVRGLILLDPVCERDEGFQKREFLQRIISLYNWLRAPLVCLRFLRKLITGKGDADESSNLRDEPTKEDISECFKNLASHDGRCIALFTSEATRYYNQEGQLCRSLSHIQGLDAICEEVYWPDAKHLYPVQVHRERLLARVKEWADKHYKTFRD